MERETRRREGGREKERVRTDTQNDVLRSEESEREELVRDEPG